MTYSFEPVPGMAYKFSAMIKASSRKCLVGAQSSGMGWIYYIGGGSPTPIPVNEWFEATATIVPTNTYDSFLLIVQCNDGPAEMRIDNLALTPVSVAPYTSNSPATGAEMLPNGNFESGTSGWTIQQTGNTAVTYAVTAGASQDGSSAFVFTLPAISTGAAGISLSLALPGLQEGAIYRFSYDLKADRTWSNGCDISPKLLKNPYVYSEVSSFGVTQRLTANTWNHMSRVSAAQSTGGSFQYYLYCDPSALTTPVTLTMDNLSLVPL